MKPIFFGLALILASFTACTQQMVDVTTEIITVNSKSALSGNTRNKTEVVLPEKSIGYLYRISIFKRGEHPKTSPLIQAVKMVDPATALAASLSQYALSAADGNSVDAFIFNNTYDADQFVAKNDGQWTACRQLINRGNCCFPTKECVNRKVFFGFRNNNMKQGLDVQLEVVAIVDTTSKASTYSVSVLNSTTQEIMFQTSVDGINWAENSLRTQYQQNFNLNEPLLYIKIVTRSNEFVQHKLTPGNRYKIVLNNQTHKLDVAYY